MRDLSLVIDATSRGAFEKLTQHRMPGALPFAGKYRLIDFALSNAKNANVTNVAIFPWGNYRSLQDHIGSGKRWNLDRRRDGLFILPPKNMMMPTEDSLTFQRMHEHIEYFKRSTQKYFLFTPASIVWNADLAALVEEHVASQAEVSEVRTERGRILTFIMSREFLMKRIEEYDIIPYKTLSDLVDRDERIKVNTIFHTGYARMVTNPVNYLAANLDMLKFEIGRTVFPLEAPIVSKEKTAPPARYLPGNEVEDTLVASGCLIQGSIKESVVSRDVIIKKDARIENSFLMNNVVVEEGAIIKHAVLDKETVVKRDTLVEGTPHHPYVTEKRQVVTDHSGLSVLHVAAEAHPFVKTGGLADVIEGLSRAQSKKGIETAVVLPLYKSIKDTYSETYQYVTTETFEFRGETEKIRVYQIQRDKVRFFFIEHFRFFEREETYGYEDDCLRFAFFAFSVARILTKIGPFDLLHLHDWHTGLLPGLLQGEKDAPPTLMTIHNIDYQGICPREHLEGIYPPLGQKTNVNFLEEGINTATKLATVSPTYRDELRYEYYGKNLTEALLKRDRDFYGVLNGISKKLHPTNDSLIAAPYDIASLEKKRLNKRALQKRMRLSPGDDKFVIGMVSRITEQKGFPILIDCLKSFLAEHADVEFVLLGQGDEEFIDRLEAIAKEHPRRMRLNIGYDAAIPNEIYAGADAFLMPSRVEPCGLSQMIAMRYGTVPIVRKTGGLADSVTDFDPVTKKGNGFTFFHYDAHVLKERLKDAHRVFKDQKEDWVGIMRQAMQADFSLERQAQKILEIYQSILSD